MEDTTYDHYIAIDWSAINMAIARMTKKSNKINVIDVPSNIKEIQFYLKNLKGTKILVIEETSTSQWLYTELIDYVDKIFICELHTLSQFESDSKPFLPVVLAGQVNLVDNLMYRNSMPLASRVVGKCHLQGVDKKGMEEYLNHHLSLAGIHRNIFENAAITAIHQGSGGLFRKANHLARGAIIVAAKKKSTMVTPDHVRVAATEVF